MLLQQLNLCHKAPSLWACLHDEFLRKTEQKRWIDFYCFSFSSQSQRYPSSLCSDFLCCSSRGLFFLYLLLILAFSTATPLFVHRNFPRLFEPLAHLFTVPCHLLHPRVPLLVASFVRSPPTGHHLRINHVHFLCDSHHLQKRHFFHIVQVELRCVVV